ncbi:hypothetical protein [uncultured Mameliella sp.]|uniref:hypothetical protein n=2 Tax=Mameliella TaxID=1434019 RepID=UPI00345DE859
MQPRRARPPCRLFRRPRRKHRCMIPRAGHRRRGPAPPNRTFRNGAVKDGKIVGAGVNRSVMNHDPTSHGETKAIRDAARNPGAVALRGTALCTSCKPALFAWR